MEKYQAVEILWNYLKVNDDLKKSDVIIVFGNHDTQVADRGIVSNMEGSYEYIE